ncbi:MAG: M23 family metallopeptidase [Treponema sp.]|nr:M23 family metallopeptidase [Treponema sp.]
MKNRIKLLFITFLFLSTQVIFAQEGENAQIIEIKLEELPVLTKLSSYDQDFKQYSKIVEKNYQLISAGKSPLYAFYLYKNTEKFTLQGLASRCNINYDTIATINQIESHSSSIEGKTLILPTVQGLFINKSKGKNSIEILLQEDLQKNTSNKINITCSINGQEYTFKQGLRLSPTERAYFLDSALGLPLAPESYYVSSEFGKRKNPFSGEMKDHNGIDLAANVGTPVYAIKDGAVAYAIADDPEFGNYIILQHDAGKMTSIYAHLSELYVDQYQNVKKGDVIGLVGQSGMATGPHLHFEIRQNGKAVNPRKKLTLD